VTAWPRCAGSPASAAAAPSPVGARPPCLRQGGANTVLVTRVVGELRRRFSRSVFGSVDGVTGCDGISGIKFYQFF
jgi:hypothetical protein